MSSSDDKRGRGGALPDDPVTPASPDELREAEARKAAFERGEDVLGEMLMAAMAPRDIDDAVHDRILEAALARMPGSASTKDAAPEREATRDEKVDADRLREALDTDPRSDGTGASHPLATFAHAVKTAHDPRPISELRNEALLRPALRMASRTQTRRALTGVVASALALAAGLFFYLRGPAEQAPSEAAQATPPMELLPGMVERRSTTELFEQEDFPQTGGESTRIDRISESRSSDLRRNRFVAWGVP